MQFFNLGTFDRANVLSNTQKAHSQISESIRRIASGVKSFSDDPVSAKISTKISAQIDEIRQNIKNTQDAIGALELQRSQTLVKVDVMQRIRELAIAYKNDTLSESEKDSIQDQADELAKLLNDDSTLTRFASKISIGSDGSINGLSSNISIITAENGEESFVFSPTVASLTGEIDASSVLSANVSFIEKVEGETVSSSVSLTELALDMDNYEEEDADHAYDFSAAGILDTISKDLERYTSAAAGQTARLNAMEYHLDFLDNKRLNLESWHNSITSTDIAEETANLAKSQLQAQMGQNLIKVQNDIERSMVFTLLTM
jgi:flagellin